MLNRNEVKYIQSLYHKKNRNKEEVFIAEGVKIVPELITAGFGIQKIYGVKDWMSINGNIPDAIEISEDELNKISNLETPNKVLAIFYKKKIVQIPDLKSKISLVLDGIQDPGNLGTIIRIADWFGIENIIASDDTADLYNTKVIQSTMGSIARVNIFYTDLKNFFQSNKIVVIGAMLNGENIATLEKISEGLLVIGNESKGIRTDIEKYIQQSITIPKTGHAESLNAAVATGIILSWLKLKA
jgi:RNA methyltransferase, TrmH family